MRIKDLAQTVIFICCLVVIPVFTFSIFLYSQGNLKYYEILDKSFSVAFGFFGGAATLSAAYIASKLFNDWKDQHNKQVLAIEAKENFKLIHLERDCIHELKFTCEDISQGKSIKHISWHSITTDFENNLVNLFNQNKDKMSSFYYLSQGEDIYTLMKNYHSEIGLVAEFLYTKKSHPFSQTIFLNSQMGTEVLHLVQGIEKKNSEVLDELKKYIFVK